MAERALLPSFAIAIVLIAGAVAAVLFARRDAIDRDVGAASIPPSHDRIGPGVETKPTELAHSTQSDGSLSGPSEIVQRESAPVSATVATLEGYVLESRTGNPLPGERIAIEYGRVEGPDVIDDPLAPRSKISLPKGAVRLDPLPPQVVTDLDGHYRIEGIPVRSDLEARIDAPLEVETTIPLMQIEPGTNTRIFRLDRSESIEGVVLDLATRRPATQDVIVSMHSPGARIPWVPAGRLDPSGRFTIRGPSSRFGNISVRVTKRGGFGSSISFQQTEVPTAHSAVLFVGETCVLEGSTEDERGRSAPTKLVLHRRVDPLQAITQALGIEAVRGLRLEVDTDNGEGSSEEVWTDGRGRYRFDRLFPIEYDTVTVQSSHGWETVAPGPRFERPGQHITLDLKPPPDAAVIRGHVRLNGAPTEARIEWKSTTYHGAVSAGVDGAFEIHVPELGAILLEATSRPIGVTAKRPVLLQPRAEPVVEFDLDADTSRLAGRVVAQGALNAQDAQAAQAAEDEPGVGGVTVECRRIGESNPTLIRATTSAEGSFVLAPVEPGADYSIVITKDGHGLGGGGNYRAGTSNLIFRVPR